MLKQLTKRQGFLVLEYTSNQGQNSESMHFSVIFETQQVGGKSASHISSISKISQMQMPWNMKVESQ